MFWGRGRVMIITSDVPLEDRRMASGSRLVSETCHVVFSKKRYPTLTLSVQVYKLVPFKHLELDLRSTLENT